MSYWGGCEKLFIIGNGFDLSVGLKTSYKDFMRYLESEQEVQNSSLYQYLLKKENVEGWVEIENELKNYSRSLFGPLTTPAPVYNTQHSISLRDEYTQLCELLRVYLQKVQDESSIDEDNKAFRLLETLKNDRGLRVLTFNYTRTIERIINSSHKICHVHGVLDAPRNTKFVFGIEDGADINKQHSFLYKSHNRSLNVRELYDVFDMAEEIVFFGYSLGQTDHSYFDDFFKLQSTPDSKRKIFRFHYYGETAYDDLYWQLRILTGKQVAKFKQFNDVEFIDTMK